MKSIHNILLVVAISLLASPVMVNAQGVIQLKNQSTDRCLNIHGGQHDFEGGPITSYTCASNKDQKWKVIRLSNGNIKLKNKRTGRCLNIHKGRHDFEGGPATSYSCADTPDQEWELIRLSDGIVKLKNESTDRCLNIHRGKDDFEGGRVTSYSCAKTPDQEWEWMWSGGLVRNFRKCSSDAKFNIREAIAFMDENKHAIKHDFKLAKRRGKRRRIRRRIDRKLHKLRFSCAERVLCRDSAPRVAMHAGGIAGRKIRICYDKMLRMDDYDFCDFVDTIAHEFGHAVGIKKARLGRHHRRKNDRVYKFGRFVGQLCRDQGRNRALE